MVFNTTDVGVPMADNAGERPYLCAVDDGYAQTKVFADPVTGDEPVRFSCRSSITLGRHALGSLSGDGEGIGLYQTEEGLQYTVSDMVKSDNLQFDGFHTSPVNRVLVNHALIEAGFGGKPVVLWTALPVGDFYHGADRNAGAINRKVANLRRRVTGIIPGAGDPPELVDIKVGCQAVAAALDFCLNDDLTERHADVSRVAVVDIGGRTTDIALIINGGTFVPSRSGTENVGVLDVHRNLSRLVQERFETSDDYSTDFIDRCLRSGTARLWRRDHDIADLIARAVEEPRERMAAMIARTLGSASDVDVILFVGGGASLFSGIEKNFPNGEIAADPEFANARGLYKYARLMGDGRG